MTIGRIITRVLIRAAAVIRQGNIFPEVVPEARAIAILTGMFRKPVAAGGGRITTSAPEIRCRGNT